MISKLEVKFCPECQGSLVVNSKDGDGGALTCTVCGLIVDADPKLVPEYGFKDHYNVLKGMTTIIPAFKHPKYWRLKKLQDQEAKAAMKAWRESHKEQRRAAS
nr:hypothetical protein [Candidatus Freyarchaeota archaeon]